MLALKNGHVRDSRISFKEDGHLYTIEGLKGHPISVTTLIHKFFPEFNADEVIDKMMKSKNWPNSRYYGKTADEIKSIWEQERDSAAKCGTEMHLAIEKYYNGQLSQYPDSKEFSFFLKFWTEFSGTVPEFKPYRTEWNVYDEDKMLSGSIDMTLANEKGEIIILDWKRSKELKRENRFQKGLGPLSHLDDCNFNHYSIQLNCYRRLLQTRYGKKVVGMYLVVLHPNNNNYIFAEVKVMDKEIDALFNKLPLTH